jgi:hypothetical protein
MKKTVVALLLMTLPGLTGAAVVQDSATASMSTHTTKLILKQQSQHGLGKADFAGTDKVLSAATHDVVGFDAITGHFNVKTKTAVIQAAFALKGGLILARVPVANNNPAFKGRILGGTGVYSGITGTVTGRNEGHGKTLLTLHWML